MKETYLFLGQAITRPDGIDFNSRHLHHASPFGLRMARPFGLWGEAWCPAKLAERSRAKPQETMYYVYLLQSESVPDRRYVGFTADLWQRIATHNRGGSSYTSKYLPWRLVTYLAFSTKPRALVFERYLKSHSGKAFAAKRLW